MTEDRPKSNVALLVTPKNDPSKWEIQDLSSIIENFNLGADEIYGIRSALLKTNYQQADDFDHIELTINLLKKLVEKAPEEALKISHFMLRTVDRGSHLHTSVLNTIPNLIETVLENIPQMAEAEKKLNAYQAVIETAEVSLNYSRIGSSEQKRFIDLLLRTSEESRAFSPDICLNAMGIALILTNGAQGQEIANLMAELIEEYYDDHQPTARPFLPSVVSKTEPESKYHETALKFFKKDMHNTAEKAPDMLRELASDILHKCEEGPLLKAAHDFWYDLECKLRIRDESNLEIVTNEGYAPQ